MTLTSFFKSSTGTSHFVKVCLEFLCLKLALWLLREVHGDMGGCGVSFSGDIQDPPGQGPVQPAVGDPASAGGLD